jgi:hypothetical protein
VKDLVEGRQKVKSIRIGDSGGAAEGAARRRHDHGGTHSGERDSLVEERKLVWTAQP